jgi:hypothetical protein
MDRKGGSQSGVPAQVQQTRARHILIKTSEVVSDADARRRLTDLRERVVQGGASFADLARIHSADLSAAKGGDLGWIYPGDTVPEFEQAMDALKPGELSQPVQSPFGWHLILVEDRRVQDVSDERKRGAARNALRERKSDEAYQDWLRQLRDRAYVEYRTEDALMRVRRPHGRRSLATARHAPAVLSAHPLRSLPPLPRLPTMPSPLPVLAITSGEPAGIGPDLCAALPRREWPVRLVVLGDRAMIAARIHAVEPALDIVDYAPDAARRLRQPSRCSMSRMVTKAVPGRSWMRPTPATCSTCSTGPSPAASPASLPAWSPRRCTRASSATPACRFPATPNISPKPPAHRWW